MKETITIFGAEKQSATSIALAYPQFDFLFYTDQDVIDGWDLKNTEIVKTSISNYSNLEFIRENIENMVVACPRWSSALTTSTSNVLGRFDLLSIFKALTKKFESDILDITPTMPKDDWIIKGNIFHKPDAIITSGDIGGEIKDPHNCEIVYQILKKATTSFIVTGFRKTHENISIGAIKIHKDIHGRQEFLKAGESVVNDVILGKSMAMLDDLGHRGFFTFNWIFADNRYWLTSFRPIPVSLFGLFITANCELLPKLVNKKSVLPSGMLFTSNLNYSPYY